MKALIGLGNPGKQYFNTKHNFGYWIIDNILKKDSLNLQSGKGDYLFTKKKSHYYMKPTTYMNNSGIAVNEFCRYFKISPNKLLVIYDDIDLSLGTIRFRNSGGTGGHKGIESIIYQLGSENFNRLRVGIATGDEMRPSEKYVLSPFSKEYNEEIDLVINKSIDGLEYLLDNGMTKTMNKFN